MATTEQTTEKVIPTAPAEAQPAKPAADSKKPAAEKEQKPPQSAKKPTGKRGNYPHTPKTKGKDASDKKGSSKDQSTAKSSNASHSGSGKSKYHKSQPQKQRNFYNPPQKVLRLLAQQSYYDNFYGNQGQFYTLKQKYKTQLCRHFLEAGSCPLDKYCQFAHGKDELRQATDPLPKNFGKTALGAVHSNYKTTPCKYWAEDGTCKFGDSCSFYHGEEEQRKLIDPLPNLPEGVTLPPTPQKLRLKHRGRNYQGRHNNSAGNVNQQGYFTQDNGVSQFGQQNNYLQLINIADIAAIGGFDPTKYLSGPPPPQPSYQFTAPQQVFEQNKPAEGEKEAEVEKEAKVDEAVAEAAPTEKPASPIEAAE